MDCESIGSKCEFRDDFFDGLRCIYCTYPLFSIVKKNDCGCLEDISEALD